MHRYLYKGQMFQYSPVSLSVHFIQQHDEQRRTSVFRVLCQSLNELKQQPQLANTPLEKLASAQALFL